MKRRPKARLFPPLYQRLQRYQQDSKAVMKTGAETKPQDPEVYGLRAANAHRGYQTPERPQWEVAALLGPWVRGPIDRKQMITIDIRVPLRCR